MARIPNDELDRLKGVDLVRLVESDGLVLKRIGKDLACACPFHEGDREPSLVVSTSSNLFHCFAEFRTPRKFCQLNHKASQMRGFVLLASLVLVGLVRRLPGPTCCRAFR